MKILQKLRVGTLLSACCISLVGLLLNACGSYTPESIVKEKYPDDKILSIEELKKELGFIDSRECLYEVSGRPSYYLYFLKDKDGAISIVRFGLDKGEKNIDEVKISSKEQKKDSLKFLNKIPLKLHKEDLDASGRKCFE